MTRWHGTWPRRPPRNPARTRFFDGVVTGALSRGCRQVVTGAAGYDGRSLRYARPGVTWFEVDHPATQQDKRARLDRLGIPSGGIRFVAADFAIDPVADLLPIAKARRDRPIKPVNRSDTGRVTFSPPS
jgi:methyltransferase (TIGR00027 family)